MKRRTVRLASTVLAASLAGAGCEACHGHNHPHDDAGHDEGAEHDDHVGEEEAHGHGHGENAIAITRFTEKLELFAEHPPAVTDQEVSFLAHLTILDGFQPVRDATVTLVLEGPQRVEARVTEMLRPGIFQPTVTGPAPGTYRARLVVTGPQVQDTIDGFEIVVHSTAEAAEQASAEESDGTDEPISFLKEQQWQIPFATAFATRDAVVPTIEVAGEVTTPPSGQAEVGAAIGGRVVAPSDGLPRPGQSVERGDLLATIAPAPAEPEAAARADLAVVEAQARVQAAQAAVERAERLIADRAIPQRELDEARRELRVAREAVQAAKRARNMFSGAARGRGRGSYRVSAPIDGLVVEVEATEGKSVQSGEHLFRIVNLGELWIRASVPEQQAATIRSDQDAAFKLPGLDQWLALDIAGENATASVVHIARTVDPKSRTVDVIYALREPDERLRVGAMVRVAVPAGEAWEGVVVPRGALLQADGRSVVYVQLEGESFEERTVQVGPRAGGRIGVQSGVQEGERVVTEGANVVRLSAQAGAAPAHGHVH